LSKKSNDLTDILILNNLIEEKLENSKAKEGQKAELEASSVAKQSQISSNNIVKTALTKKPETTPLANLGKALTKSNLLKDSIEKKTNSSSNNLKEKSPNTINSNSKTYNKTVTINPKNLNTSNNTSTLKQNKEIQNTTSNNKEDNSFQKDLGGSVAQAENSKVLNTNTSVKNLKTSGTEFNSSKLLNKALLPRESVAAAITAAKGFSSQKNLGPNSSSGKKPLEPRKSIVVAPGRLSLRKSISINSNTLKSLNRTGLSNNTINASTLEGGAKKKTNFIRKMSSASKLQFKKPNQSDLDAPKLSRQSILGKILSTRNIKGDNRTKNILTDVDKDSFEVSPTQTNQPKRAFNGFNSISRMSLNSSYDYDFDRKFSGTLRSEDFNALKRRNTKSFTDKFFKNNFYKKNSMLISPENQIDYLQNTSFHSITGSGPCDNIKIRINEFHVISRKKLKANTKKAAKFNKGKYELIESFDASFGFKRSYLPNELCVSPSAFIALNEKDEAKQILIKPPNLRKEQKDELNQKLFEKLQGNFIDESISKITKMNRLERMRNNRYSSISVSPTRTMNNLCFSPISAGAIGNKADLLEINQVGSMQNINNKALQREESDAADKSPAVFSDRTLRYSSNNDESINFNNNNNSIVKAQKKIGNSKVLLMENNFMICSVDEEKVFSPFDSYHEGNNNINKNLYSSALNNNLTGAVGHAEITHQNKQKLVKLDMLEKFSNIALNISKTNLKNDKSNFNTINANNNNNDSVVVVESAGFTIAHFDNIKNLNENEKEIIYSPNRRMQKRIKALEPQNVINLFYQMHPEKNKFGLYSFAYNDEDFTSNAFSLLKSSAFNNSNSNKNSNLNKNLLINSLHISNPVSESINLLSNNILQKLEINNKNFELEKNPDTSDTGKNPNQTSSSNLKKIAFNLTEDTNQNKINKDSNLNKNLVELKSEEKLKTNSDAKKNLVAEEGYSLTFANNNNNQNNLNKNLRESFKNTNNKLNIVTEAISNPNNTNPAVQKALLETKNTLADNIRKHKENFNDADFFDKVKNFLEAKRIQTQAVEQAYLNTDTSVNKSLRNRANLRQLDAINRSAEKANNNSITNINKSGISNVNNNDKLSNKINSFNPNNLVVVSSGNRNFPFSSTNNQHSNSSNKNNSNFIYSNSIGNNINNDNVNNNPEIAKAHENKTKSLKDALYRLNDLDSLKDETNTHRLVLPMNTRAKAPPLRESTEANEKNSLNEANIELLSEKLKKEKQMELLNLRFQEKLVAMKNSKNNCGYLNSEHNIIDNFQDFEFENFKNEFKRRNNNIHNGFSSRENAQYENFNTIANLNSSKISDNKKDEILISDEQLSEFKDKFLGKSEFIDKENVKLFYKKYLKGLNNNIFNYNSNNNSNLIKNNNANKFKNFFLVNKEEKASAQLSDAAKKERELTMRLEKLKNMLKIEDPKKSKELKNINSQNFLYEKAERKNEAEVILNNLNSSNITSILNLNESKINNANYNSAASNNNTLKLMGSLSWLKFASNYGSSLGSNNTNNVFRNSNTAANNRDNSDNINKVLPTNQLNIVTGAMSSKNALARDLKFNF